MDRADRDPVEVEADALMDKVEVVKAVKVGRPIHAEEWAIRRGMAIAEKHLPNGSFEQKDALCAEVAEELSAIRANMERTCDDLREMIRTAEARGAEGMREAAATWHDHEAAEIQNALGAGAPDRGYGRALHDEHKVSAHAIRALPLADKQEKTPAINIVFDGPPGPVAGRFVEVETDDGKSIRVEWAGRSVRSPRGDLYEVHQMSEHVWLTTKNGAALDAWKTSEASAKAVAQADHERRALPVSDAPTTR